MTDRREPASAAESLPAATVSPVPVWEVIAPDDIVWAFSDDDVHVLYHRPSGQTHFVNQTGAVLLRQVLLTPRSIVEASAGLAAAAGATVSAEFVQTVAEAVVRFEELGLLRRARRP